MHLLTTALQRSRRLSVLAVMALAALLVGLPAGPANAQQAATDAPIAKPLAPATATAPATQSGEETLWQEILSLRQLPSPPPGTSQPLENPEFLKTLNQQARTEP